MSEEKKKDSDPKTDGAKKKGLPPVILVAVGAILGGAGAVFAVPPKKVEVIREVQKHDLLDLKHPDKLEFTFNPKEPTGKAYCQVNVYFAYRVRDDKEGEAFDAIKANWERAKSNILLMLTARSKSELNNKTVLLKDISDELDHVLFPGKGDSKVSTVTEVFLDKFILQ